MKELNIESNSAVITFKSNRRKNFPGFKIEWAAELDNKNGVLIVFLCVHI